MMSIESKYFTNTVSTKFISALMQSTYLPSLPTIGLHSYLFEGHQYIYKESLVKCTKTGYAYNDGELNNNFIIMEPFTVEKYVPGLNKSYIQTDNYYNVELHNQLFKYLRWLRDCEETNLFPLFNCFNYKIVNELSFDESNQLVRKENVNKKLFLIPIEFNYPCTIAIESMTGYTIKPIVYTTNGLNDTITNMMSSSPKVSFEVDGIPVSSSSCLISNSQFNNPHYFNVKSTHEELEIYRDNIYLVIELPKNNSSTITAIQGQYKNSDCEYIFNRDIGFLFNPKLYVHDDNFKWANIRLLNESELSKVTLTTNLSLLDSNDGSQHPFSDALMEYLLDNAISPMSTIEKNFNRVYDLCKVNKVATADHINYDFWSPLAKYSIYNAYSIKKSYKNDDNLGYMDKERESVISNARVKL